MTGFLIAGVPGVTILTVATFFFSMVPVVGAVGIAVDYSRVATMRTELADALEAGVKAVGNRPPMSNAAAFDMVNAWVAGRMAANEASEWHLDSVTVDASGRIVAENADAINSPNANTWDARTPAKGLSAMAERFATGRVTAMTFLPFLKNGVRSR